MRRLRTVFLSAMSGELIFLPRESQPAQFECLHSLWHRIHARHFLFQQIFRPARWSVQTLVWQFSPSRFPSLQFGVLQNENKIIGEQTRSLVDKIYHLSKFIGCNTHDNWWPYSFEFEPFHSRALESSSRWMRDRTFWKLILLLLASNVIVLSTDL